MRDALLFFVGAFVGLTSGLLATMILSRPPERKLLKAYDDGLLPFKIEYQETQGVGKVELYQNEKLIQEQVVWAQR